MSHKSKESDRFETRGSASWQFHKSWKFWIAVILMLLAMFTYVLTLDDSVQPTGSSSINNPSILCFTTVFHKAIPWQLV